jgi:hypothetical protein
MAGFAILEATRPWGGVPRLVTGAGGKPSLQKQARTRRRRKELGLPVAEDPAELAARQKRERLEAEKRGEERRVRAEGRAEKRQISLEKRRAQEKTQAAEAKREQNRQLMGLPPLKKPAAKSGFAKTEGPMPEFAAPGASVAGQAEPPMTPAQLEASRQAVTGGIEEQPPPPETGDPIQDLPDDLKLLVDQAGMPIAKALMEARQRRTQERLESAAERQLEAQEREMQEVEQQKQAFRSLLKTQYNLPDDEIETAMAIGPEKYMTMLDKRRAEEQKQQAEQAKQAEAQQKVEAEKAVLSGVESYRSLRTRKAAGREFYLGAKRQATDPGVSPEAREKFAKMVKAIESEFPEVKAEGKVPTTQKKKKKD